MSKNLTIPVDLTKACTNRRSILVQSRSAWNRSLLTQTPDRLPLLAGSGTTNVKDDIAGVVSPDHSHLNVKLCVRHGLLSVVVWLGGWLVGWLLLLLSVCVCVCVSKLSFLTKKVPVQNHTKCEISVLPKTSFLTLTQSNILQLPTIQKVW